MPEGTATEERTMVEHEVLDLLAREAPLEPEKVHVVARLSRGGAAVTCGWEIGVARAVVAMPSARRILEDNMLSMMFWCCERYCDQEHLHQWLWQSILL